MSLRTSAGDMNPPLVLSLKLLSLPVLVSSCAHGSLALQKESQDVHSLCHARDAANVLFCLRLCNQGSNSAPKRCGARNRGALFWGARLSPDSAGLPARSAGAPELNFRLRRGVASLYLPALFCAPARSGHGCDGKDSVAVQATGLHLPFERDLRRLERCWDYGPLGVELKRNIKQAWWDDMVAHHDETAHAARRAAGVRHGRASTARCS